MTARRSGPPGPLNLDLTDRRLLLELDRAPVAPLSEIAHALGVGERTVSRRFTRLREEGLLRVVGRVLPGVDGRDAVLTRTSTDPSAAPTLAARLARLPETRWVRLSRDGSELICATTRIEGENAVLRLLPRSPLVRRLDTFEILEEWPGGEAIAPAADRVLDDLDRAIIDALGRDGRMETRRIAREAGVDPSTISRRRAKLVEEGILFFEAEIHPAALSGTGDAFLWLSVLPGRIRKVGESLRALPECRFVAACTGRYPIVANLLTPSPEALVELVDTALADLGVTAVDLVRLGSARPAGNRPGP
ncbi:Lrp/AsnC family transcriptional regulator [Corynebacterium guangdongense]|uniref:DNA-binding Lrp family transcriptional regulator n=1 Tax=Corynebacterium guangdongense TaxID=1783348 RepID=A0ABU2A0F4_9CORY|nr:Lrp/AsnC family transcriptional regulator [Corynebacterium guangdongense]MDR7330659.1 DNA-binding Lrp family transcriptional regulator [Corynebacterium guangdongense]WJZ16675.1 DNA-binding transcriptional regulator AsnC [Corynebacterium guangdongense]